MIQVNATAKLAKSCHCGICSRQYEDSTVHKSTAKHEANRKIRHWIKANPFSDELPIVSVGR